MEHKNSFKKFKAMQKKIVEVGLSLSFSDEMWLLWSLKETEIEPMSNDEFEKVAQLLLDIKSEVENEK